MKIKRYYMEDWLNDSTHVECNLSASGSEDFYLKKFLEICSTGFNDFNDLFLGDNSTRGTLQLREEICRSYMRVSVPEILVTNGTSEAIFSFFNELLEEEDEVVIPFPAFQCLYQIPISIGCNVKFLDLMACQNWRLDIDKLEQLVTPKTRLVIINNPHNPIGWTLNEDEIKQIGETARKNDCYLLFDEHYRYLPLEEGVGLIPSGYDVCKNIHDKVFATGSMIKCFGIVGIRIGWLLGESQMLDKCRDCKDYLTHTIPSVTDYLAYTALKNKDHLIRFKKDSILPNVEKLNEFMSINDDFFEYYKPTGGLVCFPKLRHIDDSTGFCQAIFKDFGVSLLPGFSFQKKKHVRINFGVNPKTFETALKRIQLYINRIK